MPFSRSARLLVPLTLSIAFSACQRQADVAAERLKLMDVSQEFPVAFNFNGRNVEAVTALYTEDARLLPPGGDLIMGRAAIRDHYAREIANNAPPIMIATEECDVSGDLGWCSGTWMINTTPIKTGKFLEILKRTPEGWRRHRDMWNDNPPPVVPADTSAAPTQ